MGEFFTRDPLAASEGNTFATGLQPGAGSTKALSFMVNGLFDFGNEDAVSAFVGAGAGFARVNFSDIRGFENTGVFLDDRDRGFAWQVLAGLRPAIPDNAVVPPTYRIIGSVVWRKRDGQ